MDSPYAQELTVALGVVQKAAKLSQSIVSANDKGVVEKEDLSPVTIADFAIQALLVATFKAAFPTDKFVGEENASDLRENPVLLERVWGLLVQIGQDEDAASLCKLPHTREQMCDLIDECGSGKPGPGRTWVFDPIDGTKTYVRKELYAINIGLLVEGKQALGVVGCPNLSMTAKAPLRNEDVDPTGNGCIVFAVKDHGAYVRPLAGSVQDVQPSRIPKLDSKPLDLSDVRFVTCVRMVDSALEGTHQAVAEKIGVPFPGCDLLPWVLRWATLAMGLGNAIIWVYKRKDRLAKIWDHTGAMLLYEETGGKITDVNGKDIDLSVGRKTTANFGFIAAPASIHGKLLEAVHEVLREQGHGDFLN
ncbi:3'(2'),5'-bisphosphate nucleotidase [Paramyrothecium foliicola]|nr:3'(2'),5'-bisphosphate nucleotidase [Paramyrothecium foliicola]